MGANGDAGYLTSCSAPDFPVATTDHVGEVSHGVRPYLDHPSTRTARVSPHGGEIQVAIREYPSLTAHLMQVDSSVPASAPRTISRATRAARPAPHCQQFTTRSLAAEQGHFDS
jgi:hypothetical protein